ncbi:ATP-binding protein [Phreatobacter oligotrophus]|uniref:Uncharacterized protein YhaN n=1 Tax=Phreatobacter oligotrophus TaxID=1122261 RepID=A0A2T4ZDV5_9HYPH|nr:AAA family ATPase [Phreatobacter oligotrophus]PTM60079.1 uncharacterized protein YhaN [Phreatobacter oligotrophus]
MRLRRLDLTRYGHFTDRSIDFGETAAGEPDFHVIYGLNEAGKSTSLAAYLDLLFGIEERSSYGFLHSYQTMEVGGIFDLAEGRAELRRAKQRASSLRRASGEVVSEAIFGASLAGLSREQYRMMFCLDDDTLQAGGEAILESKGDVGQLLFAASSGLADLTRGLAAVDAAADGLFKKRASSTTIAELKRQLAELKAERDQLDTRASTFAALKTRREEAHRAYSELSRERSSLRARESELRRKLRAIPLVQRADQIEKQLADFSGLVRIPPDLAKRIDTLKTDEAALWSRIVTLSTQVEAAEAQLTDLTVDEQIIGQAGAIRNLATAIGRYESASSDLPKRRDTLTELKGDIASHMRQLGQGETVPPRSVIIPRPVLKRLKDLSSQHGLVQADIATASRELAAAAEAEREFDRETQGKVGDVVQLDDGAVVGLKQTLATVKTNEAATRIKVLSESLTREESKLKRQALSLGPLGSDIDALRRFQVPTQTEFERWSAALKDFGARRASLAAIELDRARERADKQARIEAVKERLGAADDDKAASLRNERDHALAIHLERLDRASADAFVARLREDDAMAELRLSRATDIALLRRHREDLAAAEALSLSEEAALDRLNREEKNVANEVRSKAPPNLMIGEGDLSAADAVARLRAWVELRKAVLELDETIASLTAERRQLADEIEALRGMLQTRLERASIAVVDHDLDALAALAEHALQRSAEAARNAEEAAERAGSLALARAKREEALSVAEAKFLAWQTLWSDAIGQTWIAPSQTPPDEVVEMLDHVEAIDRLLEQVNGLVHRIEAMEQDRSEVVTSLGAILLALEREDPRLDPVAAAKHLVQSLEEALKGQATSNAHRQALKTLQRDLVTAEGKRDALRRDVDAVLVGLGASSLLEAAELVGRSAVRDRLEDDLKQVTEACQSDVQVTTIDEARQLVIGEQPVTIQSDLDELDSKLKLLDERVEEAFSSLRQADREIEGVGGDDAVAKLDLKRRTVLLELEEAVLRYARLRAGSLVASHAIRSYRDAHRSGMMSRAAEAFAAITRGAYPSLSTRPEKDREVLIGTHRRGASLRAAEMSKGTRFQLYLALRLAAYHEAAAVRPPVPFIADDIMETFDEPRSEAVMRLLGEASRRGQVIYLTHHRHLCDIAYAQVPGVKLHEL